MTIVFAILIFLIVLAMVIRYYNGEDLDSIPVMAAILLAYTVFYQVGVSIIRPLLELGVTLLTLMFIMEGIRTIVSILRRA